MNSVRRWGVVLIGMLLLAGCGGESAAPQLSALPTRTPAPETPAQAAAPAKNSVEVISLRGDVQDYLARVGEISPLDQGVEFIQALGAPRIGCFSQAQDSGDQFQTVFALADLHWPLSDFSAWQDSAAQFPEAELRQQVSARLDALQARLPLAEPLRVCLLPVPAVEAPDEQDAAPAAARRYAPPMAALNPVNFLALSGDTLLLTCSAGAACLDDLDLALTRAYAALYQQHVSGLAFDDLRLLDRLVFEGRADEFARELDPGATFPWQDALTPEQESQLWWRMQWTFGVDEGRVSEMMLLLYGVRGDTRSPAWGGLYIGSRIVQLYREQHPGLSWEELARIHPQDILKGSGYDPAASAASGG